MATTTIGTASTNTLTAIQWQPAGVSAADLATIRNSILNDKIVALPGPILPGALEDGILTIPNRGRLTLLPGDWIGVDTNGFPYLIPGNYVGAPSGISTTGSIQSASAVVTALGTNVNSLGWVAGMVVGSVANAITSGVYIQSIAAGGSSLTLTQVCTSTATVTLTIGGGWIHP